MKEAWPAPWIYCTITYIHTNTYLLVMLGELFGEWQLGYITACCFFDTLGKFKGAVFNDMSLPTLILTWTRHKLPSFLLWVCWKKFNIHMYTHSLFSLQPWR
jgi:hypothetical protein